jgi:hypothetical protein
MSDEEPIEAARRLLKQGDLDEARHLIEGILAMEPTHRDALDLQDAIIRRQVERERHAEEGRSDVGLGGGMLVRVGIPLAIGVVGVLIAMWLLGLARGTMKRATPSPSVVAPAR